MEAPALVDLHVHHAIPVFGPWWRRNVQGMPLAGVDPGTLPAGSRRLHGIAFYHTYAFRSAAPRARLFRSLEEFARAVPSVVRRRADLEGGSFILGVESMRYLSDPGDLRALWDLGARFLQPIHFLDTAWGRSSREGVLPPSREGLTALGREMLAEARRLGFILDLAHMNRATAEESLAAFSGPVMCSHTGLDELKPSARNLPADLAREIFRRGGAVGVTCWLRLIAATGPGSLRARWTRALCDTALAFAALRPGARVCVGSDRGAPIRAPAWLFTPPHLEEMAEALAAGGWGAGAIAGFLSGNALAFYAESLPG